MPDAPSENIRPMAGPGALAALFAAIAAGKTIVLPHSLDLAVRRGVRLLAG
jgi:hypothetical protein